MTQLDKDDLIQMNLEYFRALDKERLVEVAANLHQLAVNQLEKLEQNSINSSKPPSSDNPFESKARQPEKKADEVVDEPQTSQKKDKKEVKTQDNQSNQGKKKKAGHQPGEPGKWRSQPLKAQVIIPHHPSHCVACNQPLSASGRNPYMGHYVLELELGESGFRVVCQLHHYYEGTCSCGHVTSAKPGVGYVSEVEGRTRDLKLTEYVLVGPMLATLIASLGVRYRLSRPKIQEFLSDWAKTELSVGTIDRCIREVGIACVPVVEDLVVQLQQADILHLDETPWYEQGKLHWLWVAVTSNTAVFHIGSRRKEELSHLVKEAFVGWLVTDGYQAYRSHPFRQRCLAHLIRKAVAISTAVCQKAAQIGQWILEDLRELIATIANAGENPTPICSLLSRLSRACHLGQKATHVKLKALASEILNDWEAVVAFVNHRALPPTNNEAERALRHAVIARSIGFGTRTCEGSLAYSSLLSVIETCRLRNIDPWTYIAQVIARARMGICPPPVPAGNVS